VQWTIKLETATESGEVQTFDIGRLERRFVGLAAHEIGLNLGLFDRGRGASFRAHDPYLDFRRRLRGDRRNAPARLRCRRA